MTTTSSASTSGQIDAGATQFLTSQHRQVESLWATVEGAGTGSSPGREGPARQIVTLLSQHDAIETQLLYPELRDVGGDEGKRLSDHALEEHQQVREMLKDVDRADTFDE